MVENAKSDYATALRLQEKSATPKIEQTKQ
jgi:hypothetical protein